jgi:hypothetical protein
MVVDVFVVITAPSVGAARGKAFPSPQYTGLRVDERASCSVDLESSAYHPIYRTNSMATQFADWVAVLLCAVSLCCQREC